MIDNWSTGGLGIAGAPYWRWTVGVSPTISQSSLNATVVIFASSFPNWMRCFAFFTFVECVGAQVHGSGDVHAPVLGLSDRTQGREGCSAACSIYHAYLLVSFVLFTLVDSVFLEL